MIDNQSINQSIFALFLAMASSTAFNSFKRSSLRAGRFVPAPDDVDTAASNGAGLATANGCCG